jgi:kinesin family protein 3/17/kinesin family protein 11
MKLHLWISYCCMQDPSGAPVSREKESTVQISKLPNWNNQTNSYLACLRAVKKPAADQLHQTPFSPLESKLNSALNDVQQQQLAVGPLESKLNSALNDVQQQQRASGALSPKVVGQMSPSFIRELRA